MKHCLATVVFAVASLLAPTTQAAATPEPPSVSAFFKRVSVRSPKLSPSGRYLAVQAAGRGDRMWLAIIDLQTLQAPKLIAGFKDADIGTHYWVSEDRLVFTITNSPDGNTRVTGQGLWAVDRDGTNSRQLIHSDQQFVGAEATQVSDRRLDMNWSLFGVPPSLDGTEVLVIRQPWSNDRAGSGTQLARLDTRTGLTRNLSQGVPDYAGRWMLDTQGEPRLIESQSKGRSQFYRRDSAGQWTLWFDDDAESRQHPNPIWVGADGQMLGLANHKGYNAVFRLNTQTGKAEGAPLISTPGYDFTGDLISEPGDGRLLGIRYETDAPSTLWVDPAMKARQADIDAKLPGTVNLIGCLRCTSASHLVVTAVSDLRPPQYFLYKVDDKQLQPLGGARPDLPVAAMGQRDYHRVTARDGLTMPVLVTQPAGDLKGPAPTVVLVHGGPFVRGTHWGWEPTAQFLASRGYLVLEPEFRGSTGYGYKLFRAGWKQWGLAMQDDIADTLAWAVKQGWADPKRACIAGASYGGYAAMMAAVTQQDLFKCAVNWVGVTDISLLSTISWSDASDEWKQYGMKRLVGDREADAEQLRKTSPLLRASEIRMPLLMAYGALDRRVPMKHGTDLKAALRPDQPLEWVVYTDEGHGWFNLKTNEDFWPRVERFLARHLAPKD